MPQVLQHNIETAGHPFDLYVWDNASTQQETRDFIIDNSHGGSFFKKAYMCINNLGISKPLNKMLNELQHSYDAFVFMANDIKEPSMWLYDRVKYLQAFPRSGMISISPHEVRPAYPEASISGMQIYMGDVIGQFMISKQVLNKVGAFREDFGEYGPIDNDYNYRCAMAGFVNYYIPGKAIHMPEETPTDYGYNKEERIAETWKEHVATLSRYNIPENIYIPLNGDLTANMRDHV